MKKEPIQDVNTFVDHTRSDIQPLLQGLRELIKATIPDVEETISYNIPFYKYYGELVGFSVHKAHISFGFGSDILSDEQRKQLVEQGYKLGKGVLQIQFKQALPAQAIKNILLKKAERNRQKL